MTQDTEQYRAGFEALEPCPFCGEQAGAPHQHPLYSDSYMVMCSNCTAEGPMVADKAGAISAWNRRAAAKSEASTEPRRDPHALSDMDIALLYPESGVEPEVGAGAGALPDEAKDAAKHFPIELDGRHPTPDELRVYGERLTALSEKVRTLRIDVMWPSNMTQFEWQQTEKDAARYRFLREAKWFKEGFAKTEPQASAFHYVGDLLDSKIDAAIAAHTRAGSET